MEGIDITGSTGMEFPKDAFREKANYLTCARGIASWLFTLDHKRIGVLYLVFILASFFLGGIFALLIRTELFLPGKTLVEAKTYNQLFTLHGAIMIFLVIIPGIPAALGNFVLPMMLGAKDVAFPKLNLASYYMLVAGAIFAVVSMITGSADTGWTFYTPYSTITTTSVSSILFGAFLIGFSSIFTGLNFLVTIHFLRAPGLSWFKLPLLIWALYATAIIQILATPVLGITLLLLIAERVLGIGIFNPALGGDPVLFQHFFWFYSHPAVYIMILPAMGVVSEIIPVFSRKHIFGYKFIAFSSIAIAVISFLVWGHHLFVAGQSALANMVFSALTYAVAIPSAVKVFNWLATMYKGDIHLDTPMLYALSFIFLFLVGGLTGIFLGSLATDVHLHDTYFVVAHFHYTMMGGALMAFIGGIHYWWPKMFGRMYNEFLGKVAFSLVFVGFNLTFFPQFLMGVQGMPRRYYDYPVQFAFYHQLSTVGAFVMAVGFFLTAFYLIRSLVRGKVAPANPWGGASFEWRTSSPPPLENFEEIPEPTDPYDYKNLVYKADTNEYIWLKPAAEW